LITDGLLIAGLITDTQILAGLVAVGPITVIATTCMVTTNIWKVLTVLVFVRLVDEWNVGLVEGAGPLLEAQELQDDSARAHRYS
jgi:hypothetical protein